MDLTKELKLLSSLLDKPLISSKDDLLQQLNNIYEYINKNETVITHNMFSVFSNDQLKVCLLSFMVLLKNSI